MLPLFAPLRSGCSRYGVAAHCLSSQTSVLLDLALHPGTAIVWGTCAQYDAIIISGARFYADAPPTGEAVADADDIHAGTMALHDGHVHVGHGLHNVLGGDRLQSRPSYSAAREWHGPYLQGVMIAR
jgi:hypothetical protein